MPWTETDPNKIIDAIRDGRLDPAYDPSRSPLMNAHIQDVRRAMLTSNVVGTSPAMDALGISNPKDERD